METSSPTVSGPVPQPRAAAPALASPTRPFLWSVRRELWESRAVYLAPLVAAGVVLFGFVISLVYLPPGQTVMSVPELRHGVDISARRDVAAIVLIITSIIVGLFYCLDALHGERRDRSILFWKSLPVSDATAVLAKASIPLVVLPIVAFVVIVPLQLVLRLLGSAALLSQGLDVGVLWQPTAWLHGIAVLLYGLAVVALWYAPVYAWLLLVSAWARRATLLWAVLPPVALCVVERIGFGTSYLWRVLLHRLAGGFGEAFAVKGRDAANAVIGVPQIDAARFLSSWGLWVGLAVASVLLFAAMRVRRSAEPI